MSIVATTLSAAITNSDITFGVAAATGISAPVSTTGSGFTILYIESEQVFVLGISGLVVTGIRGWNGTQAVSHEASSPVLAGSPSDFVNFTPAQGSTVPLNNRFIPISATQTGATITPPGDFFNFNGTVELATLTAPTDMESQRITIAFTGSAAGLTWGSGGNIAVAGTSTTAGSTVDFIYDRPAAKWRPSRLA